MTYEEMVEYLKKCRLEMGLSQKDLATKINSTQSVIGRFENFGRRVSTDTLIEFANALDCEIIIQKKTNTSIAQDTQPRPVPIKKATKAKGESPKCLIK